MGEMGGNRGGRSGKSEVAAPLRNQLKRNHTPAAQKAAGKKAVPLGFQACVALLVASLVLLIAAAVNLFSGM